MPPEALNFHTYSFCNKTESTEVTFSWVLHNSTSTEQNYSFRIYNENAVPEEIFTLFPPVILTLQYNVNYTISATVANCAGPSVASTLEVYFVKCPDPLIYNGIQLLTKPILLYEESVLFYQCVQGLKPKGILRAKCIKNTTWYPAINCTAGK